MPNDKITVLQPMVDAWVSKNAHLMSDQHHSHRNIAKGYAKHSTINHLRKQYAQGDVHVNTIESFGALLERAKQGVFHYLSREHLSRYLNEFEFRWEHRIPEQKTTRKGIKKIFMRPMPVMVLLVSLLSKASGKQLLRTSNGSILSRHYVLS